MINFLRITTIDVITVITTVILLTGCKSKGTNASITTTPGGLLADREKQIEGIRYVPFTRYPDNKLKFPAKGGTQVCKADTTFGSRALFICEIRFDDDYRYSLSNGGYYYYRKGEFFDYHSHEFPPELRGYPANWKPCPLTFRWVTVFLDGYDLMVTMEPNDSGQERHCEIVIADENYCWGVECSQRKGPYKPRKAKNR